MNSSNKRQTANVNRIRSASVLSLKRLFKVFPKHFLMSGKCQNWKFFLCLGKKALVSTTANSNNHFQSLYTALIRRYGDARKHVTSMACEHKLHLLFAEATRGYAANGRSRTTDIGFRSDTTIALLRRANAKHAKHLVRQPRGRGTADASRSGVKRYGHRHTMKSNNLLFDFPLEVRRATAHSSQQCRIKVVSVAGWQTNKLLPPTHFVVNLLAFCSKQNNPDLINRKGLVSDTITATPESVTPSACAHFPHQLFPSVMQDT